MPGPVGDGDAFDNTLLERCQIGDDRVKGQVAERIQPEHEGERCTGHGSSDPDRQGR